MARTILILASSNDGDTWLKTPHTKIIRRPARDLAETARQMLADLIVGGSYDYYDLRAMVIPVEEDEELIDIRADTDTLVAQYVAEREELHEPDHEETDE